MVLNDSRPSSEAEMEAKAHADCVEDVSNDSPQYEPAEMEAKLTWQTVLAYIVSPNLIKQVL
jgi:hypothetical protein